MWGMSSFRLWYYYDNTLTEKIIGMASGGSGVDSIKTKPMMIHTWKPHPPTPHPPPPTPNQTNRPLTTGTGHEVRSTTARFKLYSNFPCNNVWSQICYSQGGVLQFKHNRTPLKPPWYFSYVYIILCPFSGMCVVATDFSCTCTSKHTWVQCCRSKLLFRLGDFIDLYATDVCGIHNYPIVGEISQFRRFAELST